MKVKLEYGDGQVEVNLPDENVDVFETGVTVKDPKALDDVKKATLDAILNPIGVKPISEQVHKGSKVVIVSQIGLRVASKMIPIVRLQYLLSLKNVRETVLKKKISC